MYYLFLAGRIIFGGFFIYNGINHFIGRKALAGYAQFKRVPYALPAVIITGLMLTLGGAAVLFNVFPVLGMMILILFLLPTTFIMHQFWKTEDPNARMTDQINFTKNLALIGALCILVALYVVIQRLI